MTDRKRAEEELRKARNHLELRVAEGAADLIAANRRLQQEIYERTQVEEEIRKKNRELTVLNTVTGAVSQSLELPTILEILVQLLSQELEVAGGSIFLHEQRTGQLSLSAEWALPPEIVNRLRRCAAAEFHGSSVLLNQEIISKRDFREMTFWIDQGLEVTRPEWQSYLCVPLLAHGAVEGVLELFSHKPKVFDKDDVAFFATLAREVSLAIQNARLFQELGTTKLGLQKLSRRLLDAQESERRRLALELHDQIGQPLSAARMNLSCVQSLCAAGEPSERLQEVIAVLDRLLDQVRTCSYDLRPSILDDLGLVPALRWYLKRYSGVANLSTQLVDDLEEERLPLEIETACFRITQEAVTNVVRHAKAKNLRIELRQLANELLLTIRDDGAGFDFDPIKERIAVGESLGLLGMQERTCSIGGQIEITSAPGRGTEIRVRFPIG